MIAEQLEIFFLVHRGLSREGPGAQTIQLARMAAGTIYALDNHGPYIESLAKTAKRLRLTDKVFPVFPAWMAFLYTAWSSTKAISSRLHGLAIQHQVEKNSTANTRSSRYESTAWSKTSGFARKFRSKRILSDRSMMQRDSDLACGSMPQ